MVIKKKNNKNWEYCVYLGMDEYGRKKYKRKSGYKTKKECILDAQLISNHTSKSKLFCEIANMYIEQKNNQNLRSSTINHYNYLLNTIKKEFAQYNNPIQSITCEDIYEFISTSNKYRKQNSTRKLIFCMRGIFLYAHNNGHVKKNIFEQIKPIKEIKTIKKIWSKEEIKNYIPILKNFKFFDIIFLALETGLRLGEILGLTWDCIDISRGIIHIDKSYVRTNGTCVLVRPKTDAGIREVVLLPKSIDLLKNLQKKRTSQYVFYDENYTDKPLNPNTVTTYFRRFLQQNNLRHIRFHDLRHIHATLLLHNNVNYKLLSKRLGHTNIAFTLQTYTHITQDNEIQLFRSLNSLF